jgi:hypothetical protein
MELISKNKDPGIHITITAEALLLVGSSENIIFCYFHEGDLDEAFRQALIKLKEGE